MQLTTSYQLLGRVTQFTVYNATYYVNLYAKYSRSSAQQSNNKSTISVKTTVSCSQSSSAYSVYGTWIGTYTGLFTNSYSIAGTAQGGSELTLDERSVEVTHNNDGSYSSSVGLTNIDGPYGNPTTISNVSITLPSIPRYATINSFNVSKRSETSVTMSFTANATIDYVWYSTNNGSSWTGYDITDGTSASFTISGLSPNTTYNFKIRVRRADSQLTTDSGTITQATYNIPNQSLNSKTETSITMNWSIDSTANYIWYSIDNGSNWVAVGSVNATSGSYTINGLNANTSYNIKTRVRRSLANTTYDTTTLSQTTYNYPFITNIQTSNLIIGSSQIITIYNPLNRTVTLRMNKDNYNGTLLYSGSMSSTTIRFTPNADTLYASIPNNTNANCVYSVIYGSVVRTSSTRQYSINANVCKPIFENFEYSTNLSELTGNNDTIIDGYTTTTITISNANKAIAKNSASIAKYSIQIGNMPEKLVAYSSTSDVSTSVSNCNSTIIRVTAVDSRNLETTVSKTVSDFKDYFAPIFALTNAERENGIDENAYLDLTINFWNKSFGSKQNTIKEIRYRTKQRNSSNWSDWTSDVFKIDLSQLTIDNNEAKLENYPIHTDGVSADFTIGQTYDIQLKIIDGSNTYDFNEIISSVFELTDGQVAFSIFRDNNGEYHIGINGMPDANYTLKVHGTINNS